jgi:hypothetical protein
MRHGIPHGIELEKNEDETTYRSIESRFGGIVQPGLTGIVAASSVRTARSASLPIFVEFKAGGSTIPGGVARTRTCRFVATGRFDLLSVIGGGP